ncbi:MAG TPA: hypothetical protein ENF26_01945 [Methanomicrobia archaeon]|nr:hypothetical protein [Methanomicrobia archaeon]HEX58895.1 hypothetical protein [Methanomicrobia archaeon]
MSMMSIEIAVKESVPFFINIFVLLMGVQTAITVALLWEIKGVTKSDIWNISLTGNIFCVLITLTQAALLYKLYISYASECMYLKASALLYIITHFLVNVALASLITPILRGIKINILKPKYIMFYISHVGVLYLVSLVTYSLEFPKISNYLPLYLFAGASLIVVIYFAYYFFILSKSYLKIGFVAKPAFIAGFGVLCFTCSILLAILYPFKHPSMLPDVFFNIFLYLISCIFSLMYYLRFGVEYPSLLQPKWKAYMPFDPVKMTAALTIAFLAVSAYFTTMEHGTPQFLSMLRSAFLPLLVLLAAIFTEVAIILTFLKNFAAGTALKYWHLLKSGLYIHIAATLYVFCLMFLLWNGISAYERLLFVIFAIVTFAFYLFYALDLKTLLSYQGIEPTFSKLDIARYFVCLYSAFLLILFSLNFTYGRTSLYVNLESRPAILFFILFFMTSFGTYLSMSHKGYEEVLRKNIWSELSYVSAFGAAAVVYAIYSSVAAVRSFPLRDLFFVGYFLVLLIEILSTAILSRAYKWYERRAEAKDIVELLNRYALAFLRVDFLKEIWEKIVDKYVPQDKQRYVRFDASSRTFHIDLDEKTRTTVAVAMLLEMFRSPPPRATTEEIPPERVKAEMKRVLREKALMLPEELMHELGEPSEYYPLLYLKTLWDLEERLRVFIPEFHLDTFFERLANINPAFREVSIREEYDGSSYELPGGLRFQRDDFLRYFKLFVRAVEERFPFRYSLLYDAVKKKIKEELHLYGFTLSELLDVVLTGINGIDNVLGGLVKNKSTLLLAEDSKAKNRMLVAFVAQGLKDGDGIIFASSKRASEEVLDDLEMSLNTFIDGGVIMIDLYRAAHTDEPPSSLIEEKHRLIVPLNKTLIQHGIVKSVKAYPKELHKRIVLDIYDDLLKYYNFNELFAILERQLDGFKRWNCTTFVTLSRKSVSVAELEKLERVFDNVFVLRGRDVDAKLFIEKLYGGVPSGVREIPVV